MKNINMINSTKVQNYTINTKIIKGKAYRIK